MMSLLRRLSQGRILETFQQFRGAALMCPGRKDAGQVIIAPRVRINIGADINTLGAGAVDQLDHLVHAAPVQLVGNLDVQDFHRDPGPAADLHRFANGLKDAGPFVADVGHENATVTSGYLAQFHDFRCGCQGIGGHGQHARQPGRAVLHRLFHKGLHLLELGRRGPLV